MKKLLFLLLFITGCTKYNDLNSLTIIKSIGISYNNNYHIYAQIIDEINKDNEPKIKIVKEEGKTLEETFNNLHNSISKEIFFSHVDLLVLDNNLKDNNYQEIIKYFTNNNYWRNDFYCIYSPDISKLLEKTEYDEIEMFLKVNKNKNSIPIKLFNDVINDFFDKKEIELPNIIYDNEIKYLGNYEYYRKDYHD